MATAKKTAKRTAKKPAQQIDWQAMISEMLTMPGNMTDTYSRFYDYSFANKVLLYMQGVTEPVATYKSWQALGRQVKKGAKAKAIMRPCPVRIEDKDAKTGETKKVSFMRFTMVNCLFTYSDTEGDDLPATEAKGWDIAKAIETLELERVDFDGFAPANSQGYSFKNKFAVHPMAKYPLKTTFHEFGHIVLGHTGTAGTADTATLGRDIQEFQAEATAYIVANELNVEERDKAESRAYVQGWLRDNKPTDKDIRQVFKAADTILKAGR